MPKTLELDKMLTVRMPEALYFRVDDTAHKLKTNKANLIRVATERYLEALSKPETLEALRR